MFGLLAIAVVAVASMAHAQTPPPASGDWVVSDRTDLVARSIVVRGGLTVTPTGSLTLADVDLVFDCQAYEPWILVEGELHIKDRDGNPASVSDATVLRNADRYQTLNLTFAAGARGSISCSVLRGVSVHVIGGDLTIVGSTIGEGRDGGVEADGCNLTIEDSALLGNYLWSVLASGGSLVMERCSVNDSVQRGVSLDSVGKALIANCSFSSPTYLGLDADSTGLVVEDCTFVGGDYAMRLIDLTDCVVRRCTFTDIRTPGHRGLTASGVKGLLVSDCSFLRITGDAAMSLSGDGTVEGCRVADCRIGISANAGNLSIAQCLLSDNRVGVAVRNPAGGSVTIDGCEVEDSMVCALDVQGEGGTPSRATMRDTTVQRSQQTGVVVTNGSILMDGCHVSGCLYGFELRRGSDARIRNCTVEDCTTTGIRSRGGAFVVEDTLLAGSPYGCDLLEAVCATLRRCRFGDTGSAGGCALYASCAGQLLVTMCEFTSINSTAAAVQGNASFERSNFTGCARGLVVAGGSMSFVGCRFESNEVGAWVVRPSAMAPVFERCVFLRNNQSGVLIDPYYGQPACATLNDCTFERNARYGLQLGEAAACRLVDPRFSGDGLEGIVCARGSTVEWLVEEASSATNEVCSLRGNLTVGPNATLGLTGARLQFLHDDKATYGILVRGGELRLTDIDGDPATREDASVVTGEDRDASAGMGAFIDVVGGGRLDARRSQFIATAISCEGSSCELRDCELSRAGEVALLVVDSTRPVTLEGCDFSEAGTCVLARGSDLEVVGCAFSGCDAGIRCDGCDAVSIVRTTITARVAGVGIDRSNVVLLEDIGVYDATRGITMADAASLAVYNASVSGCARGVSLVRCKATLTGSDIRAADEVALAMDLCEATLGALVIRDCDGAGLAAVRCTLDARGLKVNVTTEWAVESSGGTASIADSDLGSLAGRALLAMGGAIVRCYNTTVGGLGVDVRDVAVVEMYHQARVTVTLMDGHRPPSTLWIALTTADGARALTAPLGRAATTGWVWLMQVSYAANGTTWRTPYTAEVSLEGRSVAQEFELRGRADVVVELGHDIVAAIVDPGDVVEGVEAAIDGTDSWSWPFDIALLEWDVDYDGVFTADGWGGTLWWTFPANGTHKVALRATDETGMRATAVAVVHVLDSGPTVLIVPPPPGEVGEDEPVELDGRVASNADVVEYVAWDLGDGRMVEGAHPIVSWPRAGTYAVTLTAVDMDGSRATASASMTVLNLPPVAAVPRVRLEAGRHVPFVLDGSRSRDTPSDMASLRYGWAVEGVGTFEGARANVTFDGVGEFRVTLTVTDDDGASSSAVMTVVVVNAAPLVGRLEDVSLRRTDGPLEVPLAGRISDPDGDAGDLAVSAGASRPDLVKVEVRTRPDGSRALVITPVGAGGATGRAVVTVSVLDRDGGAAVGSFNVTLLPVLEADEEASPAWVLPILVLSGALVLVAVAIVVRWARARRAGT